MHDNNIGANWRQPERSRGSFSVVVDTKQKGIIPECGAHLGPSTSGACCIREQEAYIETI
jgi:hypothetical protein